MVEQKKVAIVGATGYGGAELLRNLLFHPHVSVERAVAVDHVGMRLGAVHASLDGMSELVIEELPIPEAARGMDAVFFALPHCVTAAEISKIMDQDVPVIDLSGDFRLQSAQSYEKYYGPGHPCHSLSSSFVYGLPELNRRDI